MSIIIIVKRNKRKGNEKCFWLRGKGNTHLDKEGEALTPASNERTRVGNCSSAARGFGIQNNLCFLAHVQPSAAWAS